MKDPRGGDSVGGLETLLTAAWQAGVDGGGIEGLPAEASYDAILVSAAFPQVPESLVSQLRIGGRLVQPIGSGGAEQVTVFERGVEDQVSRGVVCQARFVRLYGRHGYQ